MVSFRVNVTKSEVLKTLLKDVASDYITLFLNKSALFFVYKSKEIYIHRQLPVLESNGLKSDDMKIMRIDKKDFLGLLNDGGLTFTIEDNMVRIDYHNENGGINYSLRIGYQEDLYENYADSVELFASASEYPEVKLEGLGSMLKVAKSLGTTISCDNNVVSVNARGVFIFKEFESCNYTINSKHLDMLRRIAPKANSVKNYIAYHTDEMCVAITKHRHVEGTEYNFIRGAKSSHKVTFRCNKMLSLVKKLKLSEGEFLLDLEKKEAKFITEKKEFMTDIEVEALLTAKAKKSLEAEDFVLDLTNTQGASIIKERTIPVITIPPTILKGVLNNININDRITLYIKKQFIVLEVNGIWVAFGKHAM